ncbi:MAG: hypothetical protein R2724_21390 [Bryobacterales bacterium]
MRIHVEYLDQWSNEIELPVADTEPGIFTLNGSGKGQAAILHADHSVNTPENPIDRGTVLLYVTGEGETDPGGVMASWLPAVLPKPREAVSVTIGGVPATVDLRGRGPGNDGGRNAGQRTRSDGVQPGAAEVVATVRGRQSSRRGLVSVIVSHISNRPR